ncbi:hypothetical protein ABID29_001320 [Streptococcus rupicaprae]|uniref:Uncharacterized protein n=1 Tax=Streptococcus rupicaprae TaxID=759619 RepID=A0ABV2FID9_9STRE
MQEILSWTSVPGYLKNTINLVMANNIRITEQAANQGRGLLMIVTNGGGVSLIVN